MPFEDGTPTPDEIERKKNVDAFLAAEARRSIAKKAWDAYWSWREAHKISAPTLGVAIIVAIVIAITKTCNMH